MIYISIGTTISTILTLFAMPLGNPVIVSLTLMLLGGSIVPSISVSCAFAVELCYPLSEAMVNGMMMTVSLIWATALVIHTIFNIFYLEFHRLNPLLVISLVCHAYMGSYSSCSDFLRFLR
jgi:hypothetical protein